MKVEGRPCPFCGAASENVSLIGHRGGSRCVICECSASGPVKVTEPEALNAWNTRLMEDDQAARIRELEGAVKEECLERTKAQEGWAKAMSQICSLLDKYEPTKGDGGGG